MLVMLLELPHQVTKSLRFLSTTRHTADPNTVTYNTMLSALDVAGKWSLAVAVASTAATALDIVSFNTASQPHRHCT